MHKEYDYDSQQVTYSASKGTPKQEERTYNPSKSIVDEPEPKYVGTTNPLFSEKELAEFRQMKIGQLVRNTLPQLLSQNDIGESEIQKLQDSQYSKITFDVNYPVLKRIDPKKSNLENRTENGYTRYYAKPVKNKSSTYLITSEWYANSHGYYMKWLRRKVTS